MIRNIQKQNKLPISKKELQTNEVLFFVKNNKLCLGGPMNNTYNDLLIETKIFLNKKLYEEKIISYELFSKVEKKLLEGETKK